MVIENMVLVCKEFQGVLKGPIPYLAQIERIGLERGPVAAFAPESKASKSYLSLWDHIQKALGIRRLMDRDRTDYVYAHLR